MQIVDRYDIQYIAYLDALQLEKGRFVQMSILRQHMDSWIDMRKKGRLI